MPGVNLIRTPGPANVFRVAGLPLPGIAKVSGCVDQRKIDVQAGSGTKGATLNYKGGDPQEFQVRLHLVEEEDYDAWLDGDAAAVVKAVPEGKNPKAYAVEHPSCLECNITAAVTKGVPQADKLDDGSYEVIIKMIPSSSPKPSSGTPKGSQWTASQGGGAPPTAQDDADKEIAALKKQLEGT